MSGGMLEVYERYRQNAKMALDQANRADSEHDRASWFRLMRDWLALIPTQHRHPEDSLFDLAERASKMRAPDPE